MFVFLSKTFCFFTKLKSVFFLKVLGKRAAFTEEPLLLSFRRGHFNCAEILLENGAYPNPKYFFAFEINLISSSNVLGLALMLKHGANPESRNSNYLTPLMNACLHPQGYAAANTLLLHNANVNAITTGKLQEQI